MKIHASPNWCLMTLAMACTCLASAGCCHDCWWKKSKWTVETRVPVPCPPSPTPNGQAVQNILQQQEVNGEAIDFVIYEHEFVAGTQRLTPAGESHVRQIAARAKESPFPVVIEESSLAIKPETEYGFPVHNDRELDSQRRVLVARALNILGVASADSRVVVGPAPAAPAYSHEAEISFRRGLSRRSGAGGAGGVGGAGGAGGAGGGF
jgi:hypothetical protein